MLGGPISVPTGSPQCGVPAFTSLQPEGPLAVLRDRAQQISVSRSAWEGVLRVCVGGWSCRQLPPGSPQCPLYLCPPLEVLEEGGPPLSLGLEGEHQRANAALALQLAHCWLRRQEHQGEWAEPCGGGATRAW